MLGFFGPNYGRSSAVTFLADRVRKQVAPEMVHIEAEMTRRAVSLGAESRLFRAPRVLQCAAAAGWIELERLDGLLSLGQVLHRGANGLAVLERAGEALACIQQGLEVPADIRKSVGAPRVSGLDEVAVHGDFNTMNVCYHPGEDALVILDWSCSKRIGAVGTIGDPYLDLSLMLRSLVMHQASLAGAVGSFGDRAEALLEGYRRRAQFLDRTGLTQMLMYVSGQYRRSMPASLAWWRKRLYGLNGWVAHRTFHHVTSMWRLAATAKPSLRGGLIPTALNS